MFKPYTIQHVQLDNVQMLQPPKGKHYLVFWLGQYPLGHVWYEKDLAQAEFIRTVITAISPALNHYMQIAGTVDYRNWEDRLFKGDFSLGALGGQLLNRRCLNVATEAITVVICTRNRPNELRQCIQQLMRCHDTNFELLVVDNASDTDETERVVAGFKDAVYVRENRKGLDIARNTGIKYATHNIVAFTDDDVMVGLDWITQIREGFSDPLTMALTGLTIPSELSSKAQYLFEHDWGFNKGYLPKLFDYEYLGRYISDEKAFPAWDVGAGANMAFRRDVFKMVGGFDERLDVGASGCSGDSEMWYRILAEGWNCFYMPQMVVYHQHRKTMPELKNQLFHYMKGHVSALMVQYEKYGHVGNIRRVKEELSKWYLHRLKSFAKTLNYRSVWSLLTEIKGCRAGAKFYKLNSVNRDTPLFTLPAKLEPLNDNSTDTLVSVVITCYNYGNYLRQSIESVSGQTHRHVQIIVVDDGSTDDTAAICAEYPDVVYVNTKRVGVATAKNSGALLSKGSYVLFLDADDWLYPEALELQLSHFKVRPELALVAGGFNRVNHRGELLNEAEQPDLKECQDGFYAGLLMGNFIGMQSNVMYRRDLFFDFHFDLTLNGCEDYDLNLRISRCLPALSHKEKVAAYRVHGRSLSSDRTMMKEQVQRAMAKQKASLLTPEERNAFDAGVENWNSYYSA